MTERDKCAEEAGRLKAETQILKSAVTPMGEKPTFQEDKKGNRYLDGRLPPTVEIVFPPDRREQVTNTTDFPYRTIGQLRMTFPDGQTYTGTGTLIGESYVLTAAHNLYGNDLGGCATSVSFAAGRDGDSFPFGSINAQRFHVPEEYKSLSPPNPHLTLRGTVEDATQYIYDYGLVVLKTPLKDLDFLKMYPATNSQLKDNRCCITGYPGDKQPSGTMWYDAGALTGVAKELLFYQISTYKGESGAAVVANVSTVSRLPLILGVHVAGSHRLNTNIAVRITEDVIQRVMSWM